MQQTDTRRPQQPKEPPGTASRWHPFSWRRMNTRNAWILVAVAVAFVIIGFMIT